MTFWKKKLKKAKPASEEKPTEATPTQALAVVSKEQLPAPIDSAKSGQITPVGPVPGQALPLLAEKEAFLVWLSTPRLERAPRTQQELAHQLGIHFSTLSKWKKSPGFITELVRRVRAEYSDRLPSVISAVATKAEMGDTASARLFLEFLGWAKRIEGDVNVHATWETMTLQEAVKATEDDGELPSWCTGEVIEMRAEDGVASEIRGTNGDTSQQVACNQEDK